MYTPTVQERMTKFYFLAVLVCLPFFALVLLAVGVGKMERPALGTLSLVTSFVEAGLRRIEEAIWRRTYAW